MINHPYSGAASYIYASEHPSSPVDSRSKDPYGKLPSFIPSPSSVTSNPSPRRSHDSNWSREGTYTRTQRPKYDDGADGPQPLRRGLSLSSPLVPLRAPVSHPHQQAVSATSWIDKPNPRAYIHPQARSTSLPGHSRPPKMKMTPYEHDGDPLSLRRSAFVPYEPRQSDRVAATRATTVSWRTRIQVRWSCYAVSS
ncbi:hypothetical protein DFH06DRAFT_394015 [Mycena polygramma]|nr:hypothetical protein DFH06DRAFT_394015 [Mycena polygramma]